MRNFILDTGLKQIWSEKITSTANFVPCTGPINTTMVDTARVAFELGGLTSQATASPAYRMSDDGITWSSTVTPLAAAYSSTAGWNYQAAAAAISVATDQKLFVQFGFLVKNDAGEQVQMGQGRLRLEITPTHGSTLVAGPMKVWSNGSTTPIFHPMAGPISAELIASFRGSLEMQSDSGDAQIQLAYQVSDDGITWYDNKVSPTAGGFSTFGTEMTAESIDYGTTFTAFSFVTGSGRQLVRFGVAVRNGTVGKSECCAASIRIDVRGA